MAMNVRLAAPGEVRATSRARNRQANRLSAKKT